jgi:hypothetical protein
MVRRTWPITPAMDTPATSSPSVDEAELARRLEAHLLIARRLRRTS